MIWLAWLAATHITSIRPGHAFYGTRASQLSATGANYGAGTQIDLVYKRFKDTPTRDNFEKRLTFYRPKDANLIAVGAGFNDSFVAWLLLNSFNSNEDPVWSMASTKIVTSDAPISRWSFTHVAGKLCEAVRNNIRPAKASVSGNNQLALNATVGKTNPNRYNGLPCIPAATNPRPIQLKDVGLKRERARKRGTIRSTG